jgi:hypothetical protein
MPIPLPTKNVTLLRQPTYYLPRLDFGAYKLNGSDAKSASLIEGFIPLYQTPRTVTFSDLRYYNKSHTPFEGNFAFGVRHLTPTHKILGLYGSFDRFRSARKRYFSQATIGGEFWWNRVFFGANGYIPFGTKRYTDASQNMASLESIGGDSYNILYFPGYERILAGADALIGIDLTNNFRIFGGGYYFHHVDTGSISGPKLRANYTWYSKPYRRLFGVFDRIALEGQITHDHIRKTDWYAGIRFSINLGRNSPHQLTRLEQHLVDTIRRDMNVIDVEYTSPQGNVLKNADGSNTVVLIPTTYAEFADALDTTLAHKSLLGANATTPNIIGVNRTLTADSGDDQSLTISRDIEVNGGVYRFTVDGSPYIVQLGSDGQVNINTSDTFLTLTGSIDLTLVNMVFRNQATDAGVMLSLPENYTGTVTIANTTFSTRSATNPILLLEGAVAPSFEKATFSNTNTNSTAYLIDIATDSTIVIDDGELILENAGSGGGIEVSGGAVRIENETIVENTGEPVIELFQASKRLIINNSSITNLGAGCIILENSDADDTITISDTTLTATGANATIDLNGGGETTITNTDLSNSGAGDILRLAGSADVNVNEGTSMSNTGTGDVISVAGSTGTVAIAGTASNPVDLSTATLDAYALLTDGTSFGTVNVSYMESNAPIKVTLTDSSATGTVSFSNNTITLTNSGTDTFSIPQALDLTATGASAALTVSALSSNTINVTDTSSVTSNTAVSGIRIEGDSTQSSSVTFSSGIQNNTIALDLNSEDNEDGKGIYFYDGNNATNTSTVVISLGDDFYNNNVMVTHSHQAYGLHITAYTQINANLNDNTFTSTDNTANSASSDIGALIDATLQLTGSGSTGNISGNHFEASSDTNSGATAFFVSADLLVGGDISQNEFVASQNAGAGTGFRQTSGSGSEIDIDGDFSDNEFIVQNNSGNGFGFNSTGGSSRRTINLTGNMSDNIFRVQDNSTQYGMRLYSTFAQGGFDVTIDGDLSNNHFLMNGGIAFQELGVSSSPSTYIVNGNIASNDAVDPDTMTSYVLTEGFRWLPGGGTILLDGTITNNDFNAVGGQNLDDFHFQGSTFIIELYSGESALEAANPNANIYTQGVTWNG